MTKLESAVEERLRRAVVAAGGLCIKLPAILYRGIPDRLLILQGRVIFVELKRAKKARTKKSVRVHQDSWSEILRTLDQTVVKIEGDQDLDEFIATYL